jgi:hypothetical protein
MGADAMIVYYTPPAVTAVAPTTAPTINNLPVKIPAVPIVQVQQVNPGGPMQPVQQKPRARASVPVTTTEHGTQKGRPPQSW